ncbi:MAG TPA: hypothetical protein VIK61_05905, partial [Acidimicrobiia bacterium]
REGDRLDALAQETGSAPLESAPFESALLESAPFESAPFESAPFESAPSDPAPLEPAPLHPAPLDPAPPEPVAAEPATVGVVTVEADLPPATWSAARGAPPLDDSDTAPRSPARFYDGVEHAWRRRLVGVVTLLVALAMVTVPTVWWVIDHEGVAPAWASWNYEGYQRKDSWTEYHDIITTMGKLPPGRALWEPSGDINAYGTTLALELLPYFTHGRIGSMEGLYFESSATTDFHFMTVSELTASGGASNPVRGLVYGSIDDFDRGVRHLRMLGVRYFMAESTDAKRHADDNAGLKLVASVPDIDHKPPTGWKIYEIKGWNLAEALKYEPVVVSTHGGPSSRCFDTAPPAKGVHDPELAAWECAAAPWWSSGDLDRPFAAAGPPGWARASSVAAAEKVITRPLPKVKVGSIVEKVDSISFHVSRVGVPVVVKTSFFPNWKAHGARGPWRLAPNLMVVVPTAHDVRLTYGETTGDRAGRVLTLAGLLGIVALARVRPFSDPVPEPETEPVPGPLPDSAPDPASAPPDVPDVPDVPETPEMPAEPEMPALPEMPGPPDEEAGRSDEVPALP